MSRIKKERKIEYFKKKKVEYFKVWAQISIMMIAIFAFAYFMSESSKEREEMRINPWFLILKLIGKFIFSEKGMVSALQASDMQNGVATCMRTDDGKICQEYPASECSVKCNVTCIPSDMAHVAECKLGTCFDRNEGTCAVGSPKPICEGNGGTWFDDSKGNIKECKKGCCVLGSQALFVTDIRCQKMSSLLGIERIFKPEVKNELGCFALSNTQEEGACIVGDDIYSGKKICKFFTKEKCSSAKGTFYGGFLCSNPQLNANCTKQKTTSCVEGKDEIYWFDSCDNRENIYDANLEKSWNNGKILTKQESCALGSADNPVANRGTCGNCNYLLSSRCGNKTATQKLNDARQGAVCRDLSCVDEKGNKRVHGETWCAYQSDIGFDGSRSRDVPGSSHYRKVCYEGEVRTEPCEQARNEICVENKMDVGGGRTLSSASCIKNLAAQCLTYNSKAEGTMKEECSNNPFCAIKNVDISDYFKFSMCVPRSPVGHDLTTGEGGNMCGKASMKCTVVYVKKLSSNSYECQQNCACEDDNFAEQMNDLCMSMGDCGAEVNYAGTLTTEGYSTSGDSSPKISAGYKALISKFNIPVEGKTSDVNLSKWISVSTQTDTDQTKIESSIGGDMPNIAMISGAGGAALIGIMSVAGALTVAPTTAGLAGSVWFTTGAGLSAGTAAAAATVAAGAIIGAAITVLLIQYTGIGPGLDPAVTYALIVVGAAAGAIMAYSALASTAATAGAALCAIIIGCILAAVIVLFIIVMKLMKIGDIQEREVKFTCKQWQPPLGGKECDKCGKDGFKCSKYACSSLGQTCKFVNEDTGQERCVDTAPNDVATPIISPWREVLSPGFVYTNSTELGVGVRSSSESDGCIPAYTMLKFGIAMNKVGKCKYSQTYGVAFKDMNDDFGDSLFFENHSMTLLTPSLEMLGISSTNPGQRTNYNLYVKCENANGVAHERDYAITLCISPQEDVSPPVILGTDPIREFIRGDAAMQNLSVYTNEPAECRWDADNKEFYSLANNFTCLSDFSQQTLAGWRCTAEIPTPNNETKFYVRCLDKPWETNESKRNEGESRSMRFVKTPILNIDSATPDNETIASGVQPVTTIVNVETSGGLDGTARCGYSFDNVNFFDFADTFGKTHKQTFEFWEAGRKDIEIKCIDQVENEADKNISVVIELDTTAPTITRVYQTTGSLTVKTDESSECRISFDSCKFNYENATLMSGTGTGHTIPVALKTIYYVKCKDSFGNAKGDCDLKLKLL
jgi:hypothetical protein